MEFIENNNNAINKYKFSNENLKFESKIIDQSNKENINVSSNIKKDALSKNPLEAFQKLHTAEYNSEKIDTISNFYFIQE